MTSSNTAGHGGVEQPAFSAQSLAMKNDYLFRCVMLFVGRSFEAALATLKGNVSFSVVDFRNPSYAQLSSVKPERKKNTSSIPAPDALMYKAARQLNRNIRRLCAVCRQWNKRLTLSPKSWMFSSKAATLALKARPPPPAASSLPLITRPLNIYAHVPLHTYTRHRSRCVQKSKQWGRHHVLGQDNSSQRRCRAYTDTHAHTYTYAHT